MTAVFGHSTIYAARANGGCGGAFMPQKVKVARANVAQAGRAQFVDIRGGDAMETLAGI